MSNVPPKLLSVTEAQRRLADRGLEVTDETLRRWAIDGKVPAIRLPSGQYRFKVEDVDGVLTVSASEQVA
jgi:excisionase family DNA binding protein